MTTPPAPPPEESKSWFWNSLGMASMILLCCGIGPFAVITVIDNARNSASEGAGQSGVMATASYSPSPQARVTTPMPGPSLSPAPLASPAQGDPPPPSQEEDEPQQAAPTAPHPTQQSHPVQPPQLAQPQIPPPLAPIPPQAVPSVPPAPSVPPVPPVPPAATGPAPPPQAPEASPPPSLPLAGDGRIGEAVRDGQLEFVVREVKCGLKQIGTDPRSVQTQGQFCVVLISVRNVGDRPQTLFEMEQKGIGANGSEYSAHSIAGLYANEPDNTGWLSEIHPGGEVVGTIVYDLPEGIDLTELLLQDSTVPGGVKVVLH